MRPGTPEFVGGRLREAREARGLNGTVLAELIEVSRQAVSQYEKGYQTPSPVVMERICSVLNLPRDFFVQESNEVVGTVFFRSFASATASERRRQVQRQKWRRRIVAFLRKFVDFPRVCIPQLSKGKPQLLSNEEVEELASEARRGLGIGDGPITNVVLLLENHGVIVTRTIFDSKALDAFSEWSPDDDTPYIALNTEKRSAVRSRFDAVHELAHMVLHRQIDMETLPEIHKALEKQAHRFAGAFLAPASTFGKSFVRGGLDDLIALKKLWGLSISAILVRASQLGLLSEHSYRRAMTELNRRSWRTREPLDNEIPTEEPRLLRRAIQMVLKDSGVKLSDFEKLGAGTIRDIEKNLGLSLAPPAYPKTEVSLQMPKTSYDSIVSQRTGRIFRMSDYVQSDDS